jgi:EAL domain-containing protein (putative c-di-GMP-specific phosphodiesterase class I)
MRTTPLDEGFALHVNVSVRQLVQADFVDVVAKVLEESTLPAKHLTIEITESMLMQESASTLTTINRLRKLGCVIALDDFGTGYSSLSYLNRFPFHDIKIDRSFLLEAEKSDNSAAILRAVVDLTKGLGVTSVAEGVETYSQAGMLRRLGCTYGQGYLYGRPAPLVQAMTPFMTKPSFTEAAGQT